MTRAHLVRPFANTRVAKLLEERLQTLKARKSQREVAVAIGYEKPNVLSMIRRGDAKLPLEKIPALAEALEIDPAHLFRVALEDYLPNLAELFEQWFGLLATRNEHELLLKPWRLATDDSDPAPTGELAAELWEMISAIQQRWLLRPSKLQP